MLAIGKHSAFSRETALGTYLLVKREPVNYQGFVEKSNGIKDVQTKTNASTYKDQV